MFAPFVIANKMLIEEFIYGNYNVHCKFRSIRTNKFVCLLFFPLALSPALFISLAAAAAVKYRNQSNWYKNQPTHKPFAYRPVHTTKSLTDFYGK